MLNSLFHIYPNARSADAQEKEIGARTEEEDTGHCEGCDGSLECPWGEFDHR
jgi:hypothetical protein